MGAHICFGRSHLRVFESRHPSHIFHHTRVYRAAPLSIAPQPYINPPTPHPYRTLVFCVAHGLSIVPHYFVLRRTLSIPPHPFHLPRTLTPYMLQRIIVPLSIASHPCLLCRIFVHYAAPSSICASPSYIAQQPCLLRRALYYATCTFLYCAASLSIAPPMLFL